MMSKPMISIHNAETNEIIEREMTAQEFAQHQSDVAAQQARELANAELATAKQSILDRLGLTAEEAKLLLK